MLSSNKFNEWAKNFDLDVLKSKEGYEYPFAGYDETLSSIYSSIKKNKFGFEVDAGDTRTAFD